MADQINIDILVDQLRDLVPALQAMSRASAAQAGGAERGLERLVIAIGKLNAAISEQNKNRSQESRSVDKFIKEVNQAAKSAEKLSEQQREAAEAQKKHDEELEKSTKILEESQRRSKLTAQEKRAEDRERLNQDKLSAAAKHIQSLRDQRYKQREIKTASDLIDEYGRGVTGTAALREKFESLGGTSLSANVGFRLMSAGTEAVTKSMLEYGKAMYQGRQGAAVAAKSVTTFTNTLGTAAQALGGIIALIPGAQALGIGLFAAGTGLKAVGEYAEAAASMSDRLYDSYTALARVGASGADGLRGLGESAVKLGFGLDDIGLKAFSDLVAKSSTDLALFSGNVIQGRQDLAEFGENVTRGRVGRELQMLGFTVEGINEGLVSYIGLQSRVGLAQNKTQKQLEVGAAAYLREMDQLTKLTGIQRSELEQNINRARAIEQFRAKVEQMRAQDREKEADQMERYFAVLNQQAPELAQGYAESAAGLITSPAGIKFFNTIGSATGVVEGLSSGAMTAVQAYDSSNKAAKDFTTRFNALGQAGAVATSGFGNFVEAANLGARAGQDLVKSEQDMIKAQQKQKEGADGVVGAQVDLRREQMNTRDNLQKLVEIGIKPTTDAMKGLASVIEGITGVPGKVVSGAAPAGNKATTGQTSPGPAVGAAAGAATGALAGAAIGSVVPVIGTGLGAVIGGVAGGIYGGLAGTPSTTMAPAIGAPASEQKILDFIGKYESGGDYNKMVGGATAPLNQMTVAEVMQFQSQRVKEGLGSAAGKYQIIQKTLNGLVKQGIVRPSDRFDAATQDKLGRELLNQSGYQAYKSGQISADQFADRLAEVWAALPMASGRSRYEGVGNNRALVGRPEFMAALQAKDGGIVPARPGGTRLLAAEAGMNEAYVPLPDGRTIPVTINFAEVLTKTRSDFADLASQLQPANTSINADTMTQALKSAINEMTNRRDLALTGGNDQVIQLLSEMVRLQDSTNSTTRKLLQVSSA